MRTIADNFYSAAFWYQSEPFTDFPAPPPVATGHRDYIPA